MSTDENFTEPVFIMLLGSCFVWNGLESLRVCVLGGAVFFAVFEWGLLIFGVGYR